MSDLISRSELLDAFNNKNIQITFDLPVEEVLGEDVDLDDFAMLVRDAIQSYKKLVIDTIKEQPTAYDIDNIVYELEKRSKEYNSGVRLHGKPEEIITDDAIEIVKQGGVADDVCEWECKYINDKYSYLTSCGNIFIYETNSVYCPYCGKKIKVVE